MIQYCCFRKGKGVVDAAIRLLTYSPYHHVALRFTDSVTVDLSGRIYDLQAGEVIEARPGGVARLKSLNDGHVAGEEVDLFEYRISLMCSEIQRGATFLVSQLGKSYDWINDVRFMPFVRLLIPRPEGKIYDRKHVYCSELAEEMSREMQRPLHERIPAWKIPPGFIPTCPLLRQVGTVIVK
jgi:hypothetical protein